MPAFRCDFFFENITTFKTLKHENSNVMVKKSTFSELYKILDEKDEEIHNISRLNEQLKGGLPWIFLNSR